MGSEYMFPEKVGVVLVQKEMEVGYALDRKTPNLTMTALRALVISMKCSEHGKFIPVQHMDIGPYRIEKRKGT